MGRALVAWYQATGEKPILDALVRAYADYPVPMGHLEFQRCERSVQHRRHVGDLRL